MTLFHLSFKNSNLLPTNHPTLILLEQVESDHQRANIVIN